MKLNTNYNLFSFILMVLIYFSQNQRLWREDTRIWQCRGEVALKNSKLESFIIEIDTSDAKNELHKDVTNLLPSKVTYN